VRRQIHGPLLYYDEYREMGRSHRVDEHLLIEDDEAIDDEVIDDEHALLTDEIQNLMRLFCTHIINEELIW